MLPLPTLQVAYRLLNKQHAQPGMFTSLHTHSPVMADANGATPAPPQCALCGSCQSVHMGNCMSPQRDLRNSCHKLPLVLKGILPAPTNAPDVSLSVYVSGTAFEGTAGVCSPFPLVQPVTCHSTLPPVWFKRHERNSPRHTGLLVFCPMIPSTTGMWCGWAVKNSRKTQSQLGSIRVVREGLSPTRDGFMALTENSREHLSSLQPAA